jgi:hypothetical protein
MWLFTRYGFYSATCARTGDGDILNPPDENRIMVRTRWYSHLKNLQDRFKERFPELSKEEILETRDADYRYRIFLAKDLWKKVVEALAEETDYDNFKAEATRYEKANSKPDEGYHDALMNVWEAVYKHRHRAIHPNR